MSEFQPPGTPKEILRGTRIFFVAIITGAVMFSIIAIAVTKMQGDLAPEMKEYTKIFLYIAAAIGAFCLVAAISGYKKAIIPAKDSLISLRDKLNLYRVALIKYVALCEAPALFGIIAFFITGSYYLLAITAIMLGAMLSKAPTRQRVIEDLSLDWKQQKELD